MFDDQKLIQKLAPKLQRVLVVDPSPAAVKLLGELLRSIGGGQMWATTTEAKGLQMAEAINPQIIFVEHAGPGLDGARLTRKLRRSDLACRQVPVIMVTSEATAVAILGARDAGVHEFLRKPYTIKDLLRRLEAVALKPRDWVEAVQYVGPDRRRFNSGEYKGPRKRKSDNDVPPTQSRMTQALKIVRAAAGSLKTDWTQARRALMAQSIELRNVATAIKDPELAAAAAALAAALPEQGTPDWRALEAAIVKLIAFLPPDEATRAA